MQADSLKDWNSPLTPEQAELIERLSATLSPDQARWISGYLAGAHGVSAEQAEPAASASAPITILYGSETGNAEGLAEQARQRAEAQGLAARVIDMADYKTRELKNERLVLIVTATHGEGDPPDPAEDFYAFLHSRKAPKLEETKFAVLGLGDSSYEHFCQTGRDLDARLEALGAERIHARVDCDVDYEDTAGDWIGKALEVFARHADAAPDDNVVAFGPRHTRQQPVHDKNNPFDAEILEDVVLNDRDSDKETHHIELSLADSGITFEPGDALCVVSQNRPEAVGELIEALGLEPDARVATTQGETTLEDALLHELEITTVTPPFIEAYAELADAEALRTLVGDDNRKPLIAYAGERQVVDVVLEHPPRSIDAQRFVDSLRRLRPREYSIASSYNANPDEVHLTVAAVRYHSANGYREGVASTYLADRLEPGDRVPVYVQRNKNFKLPADPSAPMIMVGPGTGVAPFRAFVEEREYQGADGANWLFFGDRRSRTDFLYQIEWQRWLREGVLDRMDVAFSRDGDRKVYVQDRMREHARELYDWLEAGAYLYVCGDAEHMAPDVHQALIDIVRETGGRTDEQAHDYVKQLQRDKRYQRDVY